MSGSCVGKDCRGEARWAPEHTCWNPGQTRKRKTTGFRSALGRGRKCTSEVIRGGVELEDPWGLVKGTRGYRPEFGGSQWQTRMRQPPPEPHQVLGPRVGDRSGETRPAASFPSGQACRYQSRQDRQHIPAGTGLPLLFLPNCSLTSVTWTQRRRCLQPGVTCRSQRKQNHRLEGNWKTIHFQPFSL